MSDLSRSIPSTVSLLAESVRRYRAGFPGVARAFLPVFAVFAVGQIGLALWGEATTFGGLVARALFLAAVGVIEVVMQFLATAGIAAAGTELPHASGGSLYRRGARVFWPTLWATALVAAALSVIPALAILVAPYVVDLAGIFAPTFLDGSIASAVTLALVAVGALGILALLASAVLLARLVFVLPVVAQGHARGLASLEASAGLSERRAWKVGGRLAAGLAAVVAALVPFALIVIATARGVGSSSGASWAWALFAAAYLLVAVPFAIIFLTHLTETLRDTAPERALARAPRPWVRWFVWLGLAVWAVFLIRLPLLTSRLLVGSL